MGENKKFLTADELLLEQLDIPVAQRNIELFESLSAKVRVANMASFRRGHEVRTLVDDKGRKVGFIENGIDNIFKE